MDPNLNAQVDCEYTTTDRVHYLRATSYMDPRHVLVLIFKPGACWPQAGMYLVS